MIFFTRDQVRELDRIAIEELGIPGLVLMENAGRGAAAVILDLSPGRVAIVCGPGNNGGDGLVVARHLAIAGVPCDVLLVGERARVTPDLRTNLEIWERGGGAVIDASAGLGPHRELLGRADVVVDALFGTGLNRPLATLYREAIEALAALPGRKVALDLPSGLDADTGLLHGPELRVDVTVTFAGHKRGLCLHPGAALAGRVHVVPIGIPPAAVARAAHDGELLDAALVAPLFPARAPTAHKGTAGHVLVVGGSLGRTGAALLAANASLRAGAGLATIASFAQDALDAKVVEVMTCALTAEALPALAEGKDALAVGPGLGHGEAAAEIVRRAIDLPVRLVLDADALGVLAKDKALCTRRALPAIVTPHPGEMALLTGETIADVQADRVGIARAAAAELGVIVVLKGARTVIAEPGGRLAIAPFDNPGLGTAGTGDVLTGVIAALLAGGRAPGDAARAGVFLHGLAGEIARERHGERGMVAGDVVLALPEAFRRL
jgi:NAD(P)H-hydrate epimerase